MWTGSTSLSDETLKKKKIRIKSGSFHCRKVQTTENSFILTSFIQASVHDPVFDLHVSGEVSLQRELARAVEAFEGFAVRVEMHVAH